MKLIIGNKLYSSWSLRPWILMKEFAIPFEEVLIPLRQPDTKARTLAYAPSGKVPALVDDDVTVWESLAIAEYLADKFPNHAIWPSDLKARAHARAISTEMHAGFQALRSACPMNIGKRYAPKAQSPQVTADVARVSAIWHEARARFGTASSGPFLFGAFTAADAMYAPVVTRLTTYSIPLDAASQAYVDAVLGLASYSTWLQAALKEPWVIADSEFADPVIEDMRPNRT